jgi:hypothetical protein
MAILKQDWLAVPEGQIYPVQFVAGETLTGELLDRARGLGLIEDKAVVEAPENKRGRRK